MFFMNDFDRIVAEISGCPPADTCLDYELDSCVGEVAYTTWRKVRAVEQNNGLLRKKNTKCIPVFLNIELAASRFSHWQQLHLGSFKFLYSCLWFTLSFFFG
jgi:hypothetical protein